MAAGSRSGSSSRPSRCTSATPSSGRRATCSRSVCDDVLPGRESRHQLRRHPRGRRRQLRRASKGEVFTIIGPNGAGKTTIFNLVSRIYEPTGGRLAVRRPRHHRVPPHRIAALGIARTFQNIELFEHATLLQNLLLARHAHKKSGFFSELLFLPSVRRMEVEHREAVEKVIDFLDLQQYRDSLDRQPALRRAQDRPSWRARCAPIPSCCCSTSPRPASTSRKPTTWRSGSRTSRICSASPC